MVDTDNGATVAAPAPSPHRALTDRARAFVHTTAINVLAVYVLTVLLIIGATFWLPGIRVVSFTWTIVVLSSVTAVVAFGQGAVVLTGGFDLSIPWVITSGGLLLTTLTQGTNGRLWWALPIVLLAGGMVGLCNGLGVAYLQLSPIVVTLATNVVLQGVVLLFTGSAPQGVAPPLIVDLMSKRLVGGIPAVAFLLALFVILGVVLLQRTAFGRQVYAIGNNSRVAYLTAVPVRRVRIFVYVLSGSCAALGGILLSGYAGRSYLGMGDAYLLPSVAAVVIGGTSVLGGRGSYVGTFGAAALLAALAAVLDGLGGSVAIKTIILGLCVLVAALFSSRRTG